MNYLTDIGNHHIAIRSRFLSLRRFGFCWHVMIFGGPSYFLTWYTKFFLTIFFVPGCFSRALVLYSGGIPYLNWFINQLFLGRFNPFLDHSLIVLNRLIISSCLLLLYHHHLLLRTVSGLSLVLALHCTTIWDLKSLFIIAFLVIPGVLRRLKRILTIFGLFYLDFVHVFVIFRALF